LLATPHPHRQHPVDPENRRNAPFLPEQALPLAVALDVRRRHRRPPTRLIRRISPSTQGA
jgi:hypothetical protein